MGGQQFELALFKRNGDNGQVKSRRQSDQTYSIHAMLFKFIRPAQFSSRLSDSLLSYGCIHRPRCRSKKSLAAE